MKRLAITTLACLLLTACGNGTAVKSGTEGLDPDTMSHVASGKVAHEVSASQAMLDTASQTGSETPEQTTARWLSDENHEAFRVGEYLVTVEGTRDEESNLPTELRLTVWNSSELDKPLQSMTVESAGLPASRLQWGLVGDANFDGVDDFGYAYTMGNQPIYYHFWLWDENQKQFVPEPNMDEISMPTFDAATKTIRGYARSSASTGETNIYRWENGELLLARRICEDWAEQSANQPVVTVEDLKNGKLTEIYHDKSSPELWYDLDYTGEH